MALPTPVLSGCYMLSDFAGTPNTHEPWVTAAAELPRNSILLIDPSQDYWTFETPVTFTQSGISIINPFGRRDYVCIIKAGVGMQSGEYLLNFQSSGGTISGINFWGKDLELITDTLEHTYPTINGIKCSREDPNLDINISDCGFNGLNTSINFIGRSITIERNSFDYGQYHIVGSPYSTTSMRNVKIRHNLFHNLGHPVNLLNIAASNINTINEAVIKLKIDDSISSEQEPCCWDIEVQDNNTFLCNRFYYGPLLGCRITGNRCNSTYGLLAQATGTAEKYLSEHYPAEISNNQWYAVWDSSRVKAMFGLYLQYVHNIKVANNYWFNSDRASIRMDQVYNAHIVGETIAYSNRWTGGGGAITLVNVKSSEDYRGVFIEGCKIQGGPDGKGNYDYAITATGNQSSIVVLGGLFRTGKKYDVTTGIIQGIPKGNFDYYEIGKTTVKRWT